MRWPIIRTLIHKELLRHAANRGGIALSVLLLGMALLLQAYNRSAAVQSSAGFIRRVHHCYIDYWEDGPLVEHLKNNVPESLARQVHFRWVPRELKGNPEDLLTYPTGTGAIQLRPPQQSGGIPKIWCWYPGSDPSVMAGFESWFWHATRSYYRLHVQAALDRLEPGQRASYTLPPLEADETWVWRESHQQFLDQVAALKARLPQDVSERISVPDLIIERSALASKPISTRTTIASALVLFALFFVCVYMLPSLTCEEREHGVLLAQALSPASPLEIVAAKLLFYPAIAVVFGGILGGVTTPAVLANPLFWITLIILAFGSLGIGMTIACITKTQRAASMTALCYLLVISMVSIICQQNNIWYLPQAMLEYHGPRLLTAAMTESWEQAHYGELAAAFGLAIGWNTAATIVFRRYGWQ